MGLPRYWSKAVEAAGYRLLGASQEETAKAVGFSRRTIQKWESEDWWDKARAEGHALYTQNVANYARRTVLNAVRDGDAKIALTILERLDETFAPNAIKVEATSYKVAFPEMDQELDE